MFPLPRRGGGNCIIRRHGGHSTSACVRDRHACLGRSSTRVRKRPEICGSVSTAFKSRSSHVAHKGIERAEIEAGRKPTAYEKPSTFHRQLARIHCISTRTQMFPRTRAGARGRHTQSNARDFAQVSPRRAGGEEEASAQKDKAFLLYQVEREASAAVRV